MTQEEHPRPVRTLGFRFTDWFRSSASGWRLGADRKRRGQRAPCNPPGDGDRQLWLALIGLILLHLGHPLTWQMPRPAWWFPPLGLGLVLRVWLGPRALAL